MSSDESFVVEVLEALAQADIEAIVVGSVGAILQGAPLTTDDIDVLIRDTPKNREKLKQVEARLAGSARAISPLSRTLRISTPQAHLDLMFDEIAGSLGFEALRSRAVKIDLGSVTAQVADLGDIIRSKEAAGRPKDAAHLPILRDTLRVRQAMRNHD